MRLVTPCCGVPFAGRNVPCMHVFREGTGPYCLMTGRPPAQRPPEQQQMRLEL